MFEFIHGGLVGTITYPFIMIMLALFQDHAEDVEKKTWSHQLIKKIKGIKSFNDLKETIKNMDLGGFLIIFFVAGYMGFFVPVVVISFIFIEGSGASISGFLIALLTIHWGVRKK